ncbi:TolB family protein [Anaerobacillus alkaliphilus]|uniref:TolB family protein n=1 Tax=Anaerobacillus alkaliphilus TaxID=1548597 RepID=UPI001F5029C4|nr:hypothetical protein [Anaerobacillus alkaliphilus]
MILLLLLLFPAIASAEEAVKAAFIREGNLWTLLDGGETQVTNSGKVFNQPQWSPDGKWVLYQEEASSEFQKGDQQAEVWVYHIETKEKKKIFYDGVSPSWSPNKHHVAFNSQGILNISDFKQFYNIATGVSDYTWLPDGSGFLLSSSGVLRPDGWTSAMLFKKKVNDNYEDIVLFGGVDQLFTLPSEIGVGDQSIISVYAGDFHYSPSNKWISFIVSPTASWSMDSNMVCVLSSDGKKFDILDEIILDAGKPKWAPTQDTIAFIAGGGRIVYGFKDKKLKFREMPVSSTLTPENYIDLDFDWLSNEAIVTSRFEEREWSNDFSKHPLPALYSINIKTNQQVKITNPPEGYGDYYPRYVKSIDKIIWYRKTSIIDTTHTLWIANPDGSEAREWLRNVEGIEFY